jgi:hypothetical protein
MPKSLESLREQLSPSPLALEALIR